MACAAPLCAPFRRYADCARRLRMRWTRSTAACSSRSASTTLQPTSCHPSPKTRAMVAIVCEVGCQSSSSSARRSVVGLRPIRDAAVLWVKPRISLRVRRTRNQPGCFSVVVMTPSMMVSSFRVTVVRGSCGLPLYPLHVCLSQTGEKVTEAPEETRKEAKRLPPSSYCSLLR